MPVLVKASVALFLAAEVFIIVVIGVDGLALVAGWAVAAAGVVGVAYLTRRHAAARVALAAALVAGCVLFASELGLVFAPAAGTLLAAAVAEHRHTTPDHRRPLHAGG